MKQLFAVVGSDVSRSLSPHLHDTAARACGLDMAYVPVNASVDAFEEVITALRRVGARGCNVTIPHKASAIQVATSRTDVADRIGVANTLTFDGETVEAHNTDGPGLLGVLRGLPDAAFERVQLLGAGGSARAAAWALAERGARRVVVCARDLHQATDVATMCDGEVAPYGAVAGVTLVVSAVPPSAGPQDVVDLGGQPVVCDLAYGGLDRWTPLVDVALARRCESSFDGRHMLVQQAALSLAYWTGEAVSPLLEAMRAAMPTPL